MKYRVQRSVYSVEGTSLHGEYINHTDLHSAELTYVNMKEFWDDAEWWTWFGLPGYRMVVQLLCNGVVLKQRVAMKPK